MKGEKTGGRTKGTENKTTKQAKELILAAIDSESEYFSETMAVIREEKPVEWAKIMVKMMDFVLPKKVDITTKGDKINPFKTLSDDELDRVEQFTDSVLSKSADKD